MYPISEHYKNAIKSSNPSYLTGSILFKDGSTRELTMSDIIVGGPSITMQAVTQDVLEFGAAVLGQLDISIVTDINESRYKYYDGIINLDFNIETDNGVETIPLGEYTITEAEKLKTKLQLSAYDNLFKMDKPYSISIVGTPFEIMSTLASDCGCELAEDEDYYLSLPNGEETLTINTSSACSTYRQAASVVAQMCGAFIQANRYGKISLKQFSITETFTLDLSQRYSSSIADYICTYVDLVVEGLGGSFRAISENIDNGMTMHMGDCPAWDYGVEAVLQERANKLIAYLDNIQYTPCELSIISDPSIDCGDKVILQTESGNVKTLITSYTWKFHSPMELQSVGKNPYLVSNDAAKQRAIRDIEYSGGGGGASVLYTFKNIRKFNCSDKLETMSSITFVATKDTFVLFDGTFQVDVDIDDELHTSTITIVDSTGESKEYEVNYTRGGYVNLSIQYYYNYNELIKPYILTLEKGSHIVTLHYPIDNVLSGSVNKFEIRMSTDSGIVTVDKEKFTGTITGQGLASKPTWDGTITVEESFGGFTDISKEAISVVKLDDYISRKLNVPTSNKVSENFDKIALTSVLNVLDFVYTGGVNRIITNYRFDISKKDSYNYNRQYISTDNNIFALNKLYMYQSSELMIDSGRMCSVVIRTDDKSVIENIINHYEIIGESDGGKFLIKSENKLYTIQSNVLVPLDEDTISSQLFISYGFDNMNIVESTLIQDLVNTEILFWHQDDTELPLISVYMTAMPLSQNIITNAIDLSDASITGIESVRILCEGNISFAVSFDNKSTWYAWNGTSWSIVSEEFSGMTRELFESITYNNWLTLYTGASSFYIRVSLIDNDSSISEIFVDFAN